MSTGTPQDYDRFISECTANWVDTRSEPMLRNQFSRDGFIMVSDIVTSGIKDQVRSEVLRLLGQKAERRDLLLKTTGDSPRFMSVVRSEAIADESPLLTNLYSVPALVMYFPPVHQGIGTEESVNIPVGDRAMPQVHLKVVALASSAAMSSDRNGGRSAGRSDPSFGGPL
jgi:hypothetical protein